MVKVKNHITPFVFNASLYRDNATNNLCFLFHEKIEFNLTSSILYSTYIYRLILSSFSLIQVLKDVRMYH